MLKGYLWGSFLIFVSNTMAVLVLGSTIAARSGYPTYLLAKEIDVGIILSRMEGVISGIWVVTLFFRGVMYFYALATGFSQIAGLKDYRKTVIPLAFLIFILSDAVYWNDAYEAKYDSSTWILYSFTFGAVLPLLLLIITFVKKNRGGGSPIPNQADKNNTPC